MTTKFHLVKANHCASAQVSLQDHIVLVGGALRDLGFDVSEPAADSPGHMETEAINVMWEHIDDDLLRFLETSNVPYALICTEKVNIGLDGWNGYSPASWRERFKSAAVEPMTPQEVAQFGLTEMGWHKRWDNFCAASQKAVAIFTYFASDVEILSALGRPVAYLPFGWSPYLEMPDNPAPVADFQTFGSMNRHRISVLGEFRARNKTILCPRGLLPFEQLGGHIQGAKIGLDIIGPNKIPTPSVARVARILMARRLPVSQWTPANMGAGLYAARPEQGEDFFDFSIRMLDGWKSEADERLIRFRDEMPMTQCTRYALETVGLI